MIKRKYFFGILLLMFISFSLMGVPSGELNTIIDNYIRYDKWETARLKLAGYLKKNSEDSYAYSIYASVLNELELYDDAIIAIRKAISYEKSTEKKGNYYYNLGNFYYNKNSLEASLEMYDKSINFNSMIASPHYMKGLIFFKQEQYNDCVGEWKKFISLTLNHEKKEKIEHIVAALEVQIVKEKQQREEELKRQEEERIRREEEVKKQQEELARIREEEEKRKQQIEKEAEELKRREEEEQKKQEELKALEEEMRKQEEAEQKRQEELNRIEEEMRKQEEELKRMQKEIQEREAEVKRKEEQRLKDEAERLKREEERLRQEENLRKQQEEAERKAEQIRQAEAERRKQLLDSLKKELEQEGADSNSMEDYNVDNPEEDADLDLID